MRSVLITSMCCLSTIALAAGASGVVDGKPISSEEVARLMIVKPLLIYPYEARSRRLTGRGIMRLFVDKKSGRVVRAEMAKSTRSGILDEASLAAVRKVRFKPNTIEVATVPITWTLSG